MKKILFLIILMSSAAMAEPQKINIGIYALNIGKFDISSGSYTVDFYLTTRCDGNCSESFEFMNGRSTSFDKQYDDGTTKFYRIQASLSQNIDLRSYPFDSHNLSIEIEDKVNNNASVIYQIDREKSGIDPFVTIVGWEIIGWDANVTEHYYGVYNETYSRYVFDIHIKRTETSSLIKNFLPIFFIVFISLLSHLLAHDKLPQRLAVNTSSLLAAVLFHINSTASIPPLGYLTFIDRFMALTYVVLIGSTISTVYMMWLSERKKDESVKKIHDFSMILMPVVTIVLYALAFTSI